MIKTLKYLLKTAKPEVLVFIFFALIFLATTNGRVTMDSYGTFSVVDNFFYHHNFSIECGRTGYFLNTFNNQCYSQYPFFYFVLMLLFFVVGQLFGFLGGDAYNTSVLFVSLINVFAGALLCAYVFKFLKKLGSSYKAALLVVLFLGLGTMLWPCTKGDFSELPNTLFLFLAIYYLYIFSYEKRKQTFWASAIFIALAIGIKLYTIIALPILLIYFYFVCQDKLKEKIKQGLIFLIPTFLVLLVSGWYNYIRTNSFLETGYPTGMFIGFNPILYFSHIYGLLFSSGRSIFLFNIPLIISLFCLAKFHQKHKKEFRLILSISMIYVLFLAGFYTWNSGLASWGPRKLMPIIPLLIIPSYFFFERIIHDQRLKKGLIVLLFVFCCLIQFSAVFLPVFSWYSIFKNNQKLASFYQSDVSISFLPYFSPIIGQPRLFFSYIKSTMTHDENNIEDIYEFYVAKHNYNHQVMPTRLIKEENIKVNLAEYVSRPTIFWFQVVYNSIEAIPSVIVIYISLLISSYYIVHILVKRIDENN